MESPSYTNEDTLNTQDLLNTFTGNSIFDIYSTHKKLKDHRPNFNGFGNLYPRKNIREDEPLD